MSQEKNASEAKQLTAQEQIDAINLETAELNRQLALANLEAKKQELEDLKARNAEARSKRQIEEQRLINSLRSDEQRRADEGRKRAWCNHTQGGEGLEGLYQGDGIQSTYQKETDVIGRESYRCIRCGNPVRQAENPEEFKRIKKLPHKGLVGPVPVLFHFIDNAGNPVKVEGVVFPE